MFDIKSITNSMNAFEEVAQSNLSSVGIRHDESDGRHSFTSALDIFLTVDFIKGGAQRQLELDGMIGGIVKVFVTNYFKDLGELLEIHRSARLKVFNIRDNVLRINTLITRHQGNLIADTHVKIVDAIIDFTEGLDVNKEDDNLIVSLKLQSFLDKVKKSLEIDAPIDNVADHTTLESNLIFGMVKSSKKFSTSAFTIAIHDLDI